MLLCALAYARAGFRVLPLHWDPRDPSVGKRDRCKRPLIAGGVNAATTDVKVIRRWWATWPNANIGIATDGLIVLDIDDPAKFKAFVQHEAKTLPPTKMVATGRVGGQHYWYRAPDGHPLRGMALRANGLDVKAAPTGYVVAPPSMHATGRRYEVACACQIEPAPGWLVDLVGTAGQHNPRRTAAWAEPSREDAEAAYGDLDQGLIDVLNAEEPGRSEAVFRAVSRLQRRGGWAPQKIATAVWKSPAADRYKSWAACVEDVLRILDKVAFDEADAHRYLDAVDADPRLTLTEQRLCYGFAHVAWKQGQRRFTAGKYTLAIHAGVDPKTVFKHLYRLADKGFIHIVKECTDTSARVLALPIHTALDREGYAESPSAGDLNLIFTVASHDAFRAPQMRNRWREQVTRAREGVLPRCEVAALGDTAAGFGRAGRTEALLRQKDAKALERRNARRAFIGLEELGVAARVQQRAQSGTRA